MTKSLTDILKKYIRKPVAVVGLAALLICGSKTLFAKENETKWRREYSAVVNGNYYPNGYDKIHAEYGDPTFCDIDGDGDYDMFLHYRNTINFWRNNGDPNYPSWRLVTKDYNPNEFKNGRMSLAFCDIDNDGDYDMFVGEGMDYTKIHSYRNDGTPTSQSWTLVTKEYASINVDSSEPTPTFCDIDGDGDYDLFVGEWNGNISFSRNDGTPTSPSWTLVTKEYASINVGEKSSPTFCDIDGDGDYDLFVGKGDTGISFYRNDGTPTSPSWTLVTKEYASINVGWNSIGFCDIDNDGDPDMFVGSAYGSISFWRNMGLEKTLSADIDNNGIVDFKDFSKFAEQWLMTEEWYDGE